MAKVFLLTGLSGAGKTSLAEALLKRLSGRAREFVLLDGDAMRKGMNSDLGFSGADREENIRRGGELAKLLAEQGFNVILAVIAPYESLRKRLAEIVGADRLRIVHVACPLEVCIQRDPKKNYQKALAGHAPNYTGIEDRYELPLNPDLVIDTHGASVDEAAAALHEFVKKEI